VLITLGVVFLLVNFGYISWRNFGHYFARYWPLLLILWGVIKLVEYMQDQRSGLRPRGIGVGGAFLVIMLVLFGIAATTASRVNWGAIQSEMDIDGDFGTWFGNRYDYDQTLEQPFPAGARLQVASDRGNIMINPWDQPQVRLVVRKHVAAHDENEARQINEQTQPQISTAGQIVTINANTRGGGNSPVQSDLEIFVPRAAAVELSTRHGDISVRDRGGNVKTSTSHGDISLQAIDGNVEVDIRRGDVRAQNVKGDVTVNGRANDTIISDVGGNVRLNGDFFGEISVAKVARSVSFKSSRSDIEMARLDGDMALESGDLRVRTVTGPVRILTRSKDIHLEDVAGDVRVENSNGEIELHSSRLGTIEIENRRGAVELVLPPRAAFELEAVSRRGEISSEFEGVNINSQNGESRATGSVGKGGPKLQVNSMYGDVQIRKGSGIPAPPTPPTTPAAPTAPATPTRAAI
jgi:DUF4097 and DUF4098 domain-containing protein YvlB